MEGLIDAMPDVAVEVVEVRDLGRLTLAALRLRSHGASDTPTDMPLWLLAEGVMGSASVAGARH